MSLHTQASEIEDFREKIRALEKTKVPLWSLEQLSEYINWTLQKLSPLQVGDTAELFRDPGIDPGSGWYPHRENLNVGRKGAIIQVDWVHGKYLYLWAPENQTWTSKYTGEVLPVDRPYHFMLSQDYLRPVFENKADDAAAKYADSVVGSNDHQNYLQDLTQPDGTNDIVLPSLDNDVARKAQRSDLKWVIAEAFRAGVVSR